MGFLDPQNLGESAGSRRGWRVGPDTRQTPTTPLLLQLDPACSGWAQQPPPPSLHAPSRDGGHHGCFVSGMRCNMEVPGHPFAFGAAQRQDMQMHDANWVRPGATLSGSCAAQSYSRASVMPSCCRIMREGAGPDKSDCACAAAASKLDAGGEQRTIQISVALGERR